MRRLSRRSTRGVGPETGCREKDSKRRLRKLGEKFGIDDKELDKEENGIEFRIDNEYCENGDIFAINSSDHTNALLRPKLVLKGVDLPPQVLTRDASFGVRTNQFGFTITGTSN